MQEIKTDIDEDGYKFVDYYEGQRCVRKSSYRPDGTLINDVFYKFNERDECLSWEVYNSSNQLVNRFEFTFNPDGTRKDVIMYNTDGIIEKITPHDKMS
jgi:hypothetical protein